MKKFSGLLIAVVAIAVALSSCNKEEPVGTFHFRTAYQCNKADTAAARQLVDICKQFEYFKQTHEYTGTYTSCCEKAAGEFFTASLQIGEEVIVAHLDEMEYFRVLLLCSDNGEAVAYTTWTPKKPSEQQ